MSDTYKIGDKVRLTVGGPDMVVSHVVTPSDLPGATQRYRCQWFAGKKLADGVFPHDSLIPVTDDKKDG